MKKRILLIGNNNGLPGVNLDIKNYKAFFKGNLGGAWDEDLEIYQMINPSRISLLTRLALLKAENLDYLIVVFSGHGGQERETVLELNKDGDVIYDSELKNIAKRQLNIYDCCRCFDEVSKAVESKQLFASARNNASIRKIYEERIMQAIPQQVSLYACSIGEVAHDTKDGGVYSLNLLQAAKNVPRGYFKLIGEAHQEAYKLTMVDNLRYRESERQNPEADLPRCLSRQQLIIGYNPFV